MCDFKCGHLLIKALNEYIIILLDFQARQQNQMVNIIIVIRYSSLAKFNQ